MILLSGADIILPDRIVTGGALAIDGEQIVEVRDAPVPHSGHPEYVDLHEHYLVPGFIDVHVHGLEGLDTLDDAEAIDRIAARLPRHGVTGFCPTSIACSPAVLKRMLDAIRAARLRGPGQGARVLPAHLESNFINPEFKGAQPLECIRLPKTEASVRQRTDGDFTGEDILAEIEAARPDVGIVTVAPEMPGVLELIRSLTSHGHHVSLGHSGATYEEALAGIAAGATQATHLFNRMPPLAHRAPGLAGAVLDSEEVAAEVVCDGVHVHPAVVRMAIAAKHPSRVMAITDGTAGSGLPRGATSVIGGRTITVREAAYLDDGTLAGSVLTMAQAFARLVTAMGLSLVDAALVCSTTPARELRLHGLGAIAPGAIADLVVLDRDLQVVRTYIAGRLVWEKGIA
ncbi:MAG TPA: N-acetylglucosamine-6-phosphate deacetylase [Vicinamibacterales bacterium]|nr:N-acetylglucosamine-6-phosphate deacetylase [Vicinamibacterales bacterium]